jgi:hypothetical protein
MPDVVVAFDVEDPVNEAADDALMRLCRLLSTEGVPASLFVAGEKARVLRQRGRRDVLAAMREHEICYHGNYWGDYPVPALHYGQEMNWDDAVAYALRTEAPGLHDVAEITGQFPVAWCPHQAQSCPQLAYALKLAGVRCFAGGPRGWLMNWLSWGRSGCTTTSQPGWEQRVDPTQRGTLKAPLDVTAALHAFQSSFEHLAASEEFVTVVGHPTCWVTADWGGLYGQAVVFRHGVPGAYPRPAGIPHSQPRSAADSEAAFDFLRQQVRWLKTRTGVNLTSYAALCDLEDEEPVLWLDLEQVLGLARSLREKLNYTTAFGTSFAAADVLGLLNFACDYCWRQGRWPTHLPVQRLLGPTERPLAMSGPVTLSRENLFAGALAAYAIMMDQNRIPGILRASMVDVGPGTWLRALTEFVLASVESGQMPLAVTVDAAQQLPECVNEAVIQRRQFGSSSRAPGLSVEPIREILCWQSWSYRPAVRRQ